MRSHDFWSTEGSHGGTIGRMAASNFKRPWFESLGAEHFFSSLLLLLPLSFQNELLGLLKGKLTVSNFHIILVSIVVLENARSLRFQSPQ